MSFPMAFALASHMLPLTLNDIPRSRKSGYVTSDRWFPPFDIFDFQSRNLLDTTLESLKVIFHFCRFLAFPFVMLFINRPRGISTLRLGTYSFGTIGYLLTKLSGSRRKSRRIPSNLMVLEQHGRRIGRRRLTG